MKRILFVKIGAIGDVIQAAAAMNEYRRSNPNTMIDWVVGSSTAELLEKMNVANHIISIDEEKLMIGNKINRLSALLQSIWKIAAQSRRYDAVYVGHTNWQYRLLIIGTYLKNFSPVFKRQSSFLPRLTSYRVSEYLRFITGIEMSHQEGANALQRLGKNILQNRSPLVNFINRNRNSGEKYIAIVPGGSKNALRDDFLRRWPIDQYVELTKLCIAQGHKVILVGSKADAWVKPYFSDTDVIDLIGKTHLQELVQVISELDLFISHDTGPLHLASLTTTPMISLFGATPVSAVAPLGRQSIKVFSATPQIVCAPCYDGKNYASCSDPICMKSISAESVFESAKNMLTAEGV